MKKVKVQLRKDTPVLLESDFVNESNKVIIPEIIYLKPYICSITFYLQFRKLNIMEIEKIDKCSERVINEVLKAGTFHVNDYELLNFYFEICNEPTRLYHLKKDLKTLYKLNEDSQSIVNKLRNFDKTSLYTSKIVNLSEYSEFTKLKTKREKINNIFNNIYSEDFVLFDRINSRILLNLPKKVISDYNNVDLII